MEKTELEKLQTKITQMELADQIELAKSLLSGLNLYTSLIDNEHDEQQLDELVKLLSLLINTLQDKVARENLIELLYEIEQLPSDSQKKLLTRLVNLILKFQKDYHHELTLTECQTYGHTFGEWTKFKWYTPDRECKYWKRTCLRCGHIEEVDLEPYELVHARLEKYLQDGLKKERKLTRTDTRK